MGSTPANALSISEVLQKLSNTLNPTSNQEFIEIVSNYLKFHKQDYTRFDSIRWINNMRQMNSSLLQNESERFVQENNKLILKSKKEIQNLGLISYLKEYNIPLHLARKHLKELTVHDIAMKKDFFVLGFTNEEDGFEIRSPLIKGCVGPKYITFIKGTKENSETLHIFKSFWDYLSFLSYHRTDKLSIDCIVLNSFVCLGQAIAYIKSSIYTTIYTWMDNFPMGEQATQLLEEFIKEETHLKHKPMNYYYSPYTDLSKWYQSQIKHQS